MFQVLLIFFVATIMDLVFWDFLVLCQIFFLAEVKGSVIISNKHGTYELPYKMGNDFIILGN